MPSVKADALRLVSQLNGQSEAGQVVAAEELLVLAHRDRLACALAGALSTASRVYQAAQNGTPLERNTMSLLNALIPRDESLGPFLNGLASAMVSNSDTDIEHATGALAVLMYVRACNHSRARPPIVFVHNV